MVNIDNTRRFLDAAGLAQLIDKISVLRQNLAKADAENLASAKQAVADATAALNTVVGELKAALDSNTAADVAYRAANDAAIADLTAKVDSFSDNGAAIDALSADYNAFKDGVNTSLAAITEILMNGITDVDPDNKIVGTPLDLAAALAEGGSVKLDADVVLGADQLTVAKDTVLDLGGHTIKPAAETAGFGTIEVRDGASLTIKNGSVDASGSERAAIAAFTGNVTVEDGNYTGGDGCSCVYAGPDCSVVVNGGYFKVSAPWPNTGKYYVLNIKDGSNAKFVVNGGQFENFDPANADIEKPAVNWVAEGKTSTQTSTDPVVYTVA